MHQTTSTRTEGNEPDPPIVEHVQPEDTVSAEVEENPPLLIPQKTFESFRSIIFNENLEHSYDGQVFQEVNAFYRHNGNRTRWLGAEEPEDIYRLYMQLNDDLWKDGLNAGDYRFNQLRLRVQEAYAADDIQELAALDFQLTFSFFLLSHHLAYGKINPRRLDSLWFVDEPQAKVFGPEDLLRISEEKDLDGYLKKIRPPHEQYDRLRKKLITFTHHIESASYRDFYPGKQLVSGDRGEAVRMLRRRLAVEDPLLGEPKDAEVFDEALRQAVMRFQRSYGLDADGIVGPETLEYLNIPMEEDLKRIRINLERIRWMPRTFGENYIIVNIPDYSLRLVENHREKLSMKVIVGQVMNKTPVFSDTLEYLVFSPTWVIPQSIKVKEMLPRLQEDSSYYSGGDYVFYESWTSDKEVDPTKIDWSQIDSTNFVYNIVQQPGPANALGRVKFIMPNDQYIYLHDTPQDHLFSQEERNFSHGCIRVEKPLELAHQLLKDQFLFPELKVARLALEDEPHEIPVKKIYHVQIMYRTTWVDEQGMLQRRRDVYGLDDVQLSLLK